MCYRYAAEGVVLSILHEVVGEALCSQQMGNGWQFEGIDGENEGLTAAEEVEACVQKN